MCTAGAERRPNSSPRFQVREASPLITPTGLTAGACCAGGGDVLPLLPPAPRPAAMLGALASAIEWSVQASRGARMDAGHDASGAAVVALLPWGSWARAGATRVHC